MMTDNIADFLTRIRNIIMINGDRLEVPATKMKANICKVLKDEGYIKSFKIILKDSKIFIKIVLNPNAIKGIQRVSRPGLRIYSGYADMKRVLNGLGISVVSTSSGVISSREAKKRKLGGEIICNVW